MSNYIPQKNGCNNLTVPKSHLIVLSKHGHVFTVLWLVHRKLQLIVRLKLSSGSDKSNTWRPSLGRTEISNEIWKTHHFNAFNTLTYIFIFLFMKYDAILSNQLSNLFSIHDCCIIFHSFICWHLLVFRRCLLSAQPIAKTPQISHHGDLH